MGSLVWVKRGDGNARPQPKGKGRGERGARCKGAETPAVYTRPRMESHVRDPGQAAPCRPAETATRPMARAARSGNGESRSFRQRRVCLALIARRSGLARL